MNCDSYLRCEVERRVGDEKVRVWLPILSDGLYPGWVDREYASDAQGKPLPRSGLIPRCRGHVRVQELTRDYTGFCVEHQATILVPNGMVLRVPAVWLTNDVTWDLELQLAEIQRRLAELRATPEVWPEFAKAE